MVNHVYDDQDVPTAQAAKIGHNTPTLYFRWYCPKDINKSPILQQKWTMTTLGYGGYTASFDEEWRTIPFAYEAEDK